jgi:hypothetical protein
MQVPVGDCRRSPACSLRCEMSEEELLRRQMLNELTKYSIGTGLIAYKAKGSNRIDLWPICVSRSDDRESLRLHLKRWLPNTEFVDAVIKR